MIIPPRPSVGRERQRTTHRRYRDGYRVLFSCSSIVWSKKKGFEEEQQCGGVSSTRPRLCRDCPI
ncbi:hypothetical protein HYS47_05480 [Candidatus Woesearchaeota archaeon]|nr:hypothetical protein [Candidatus Woesearchaeota archaeon]